MIHFDSSRLETPYDSREHMSFSQFDSPSQNPYSQPTHNWPVNTQQPEGGSTTQFTLLGISFLILAVLGLGMSILFAIGQTIQIANGEAVPPPNTDEAERIGFYIGYWGTFVVTVVSGLIHPFVAFAGFNMIRRKGLGMAKLGAILMCIPCVSSCCLLGVPFGIWGIIALNSISAKQLFS
jgi:hypothetical protein